MDADGLPLIGPGIDLTKVEPINQKRTLAFINHFVVHTAHFLNRFSGVCEEKLADISSRLQRLETSLKLLEGKLASVPGLENVTVANSVSGTSNQSTPTTGTPTAPSNEENKTDLPPAKDQQNESVTPREDKPQNTAEQDPRYARFFKMLQVGIPSMAVKQKMQMEGLDPDVLDNPGAAVSSEPANARNDTDSDFSEEEQKVGSDEDDDSSGFSD